MKKITRIIKNFFRHIKWFFQRGFKGYCDKDLWSLRDWFNTVFPKMLREFEADIHSVPSFNKEIKTKQDWEDIIERMAIALERTNEDFWIESAGMFTTAHYSKMEINKEAFMDMFSKYYFDLWD